MKHYLLSMMLSREMYLHCYVMSNDKDIVRQASDKMVYEAEQRLGPIMAPILVATGPLKPPTVKQVRDVLTEVYPKALETLAKAKDFHITIWAMPKELPGCKQLLEIH